jgi:hypothetical protein
MISSAPSIAPRSSQQTACAPLSILRTETVLSRFPIHNLTKHGPVTIRIRRTNAHGELEVRWDVSYNEHYGPPGPLAYKLDTLVINQRLDALPRPLPTVLRVDSLRQIGALLDLNDSGRQQAHLKRAFHQNASAYIVAKLRYRGRDGTERRLETGFTRYSVVWTGERLPDGTTADAVYLLLSEPYREVLNQAPVRPLDYTYLKLLTPTAQRFYELLSYKIFAALKHRQPHATLRYADYCLLAPQPRATDYDHVKKQMYKVHQRHLASHYLTQVRYDVTTDEEGRPDWLMQYTPGPKARAEYAAFIRQPGAAVAAALVSPDEAAPEALAAPRTEERPTAPLPPQLATSPPPGVVPADREPAARLSPIAAAPPATDTPGAPPATPLQAQALVTAFYQRFYGVTAASPQPKELEHAAQLLTQYGEAKALYLVDFSYQAARETQYQPQTFMGILHYLPRALAAYDARATQATARQAAAATRRWQERYVQWRQEAVARLRAALPAEELAALEAEHQARLVAEGTPAFALGLAVRVAVDAALEARAGLPSFAVWRQTQEAGR